MSRQRTFLNRREAGRELAKALKEYAGRKEVLVVALPRGGVPVGYEVAKALQVALDVLVVRKLGLPGHEELAMGAIGARGVRVMNPRVAAWASAEAIEAAVAKEATEVERREKEYRAGRGAIDVEGKTLIVVDDGFATGSTMKTAVAVLRGCEAKMVVVAAPVGAASTCKDLEKVADKVVCLWRVEYLGAVGMWYVDFEQTTDVEVAIYLAQAQYS